MLGRGCGVRWVSQPAELPVRVLELELGREVVARTPLLLCSPNSHLPRPKSCNDCKAFPDTFYTITTEISLQDRNHYPIWLKLSKCSSFPSSCNSGPLSAVATAGTTRRAQVSKSNLS